MFEIESWPLMVRYEPRIIFWVLLLDESYCLILIVLRKEGIIIIHIACGLKTDTAMATAPSLYNYSLCAIRRS